jgi:hypothetical protein
MSVLENTTGVAVHGVEEDVDERIETHGLEPYSDGASIAGAG